MNQTDDRVLELLEESGLDLSASVLAHNLDYSRSWVSRRMAKLADAGLVESQGTYYRITEKGRDYLLGNLTQEDLELDDE